MSHLRLVPPATPTPKQAAIERVKRMANPRNELQCPRCGSRTYITVRNGATHDGTRLIHGAMIQKIICAHCYKDGITQTLLPPELKRIR